MKTKRNAIIAAERNIKEAERKLLKGRSTRTVGEHAVHLQNCKVSECTLRYLAVLAEPWLPLRVCLPMPPCLPSTKYASFIRGNAVINASGYAFVAVSPANMCNSTNAAVTFSTGTYGGTTIDTNSATAGVSAALSNAPNSLATYAASLLQWRIVAVGLRVRYSGTELNRAGDFFCLVEPDHVNMDAYSAALMGNYHSCSVEPVTRGWHTVVWHPIDANDYMYKSDSSMPGTATDSGDAPMAIAIGGGVPNESLYFEVFCHYEVIGRNARGATSMPGDPIGGAAAMQAIAQFHGGSTGASNFQTLKKNTEEALAGFSSVSGVVKDAWSDIKAAKDLAKSGYQAVRDFFTHEPELEALAALAAR